MSEVIKLITPYAVRMTRTTSGEVEVLVVSQSLHKNNQNLETLVSLGFTVSKTLARTKGGLSFGANAQFQLYVVGGDVQAKLLDPQAYELLTASESPEEVVEKPVPQAEVPEDGSEVVSSGETTPPTPNRTRKVQPKKVD